MRLYLMRHGESVSERENPEQPLSRAGIATIQATAAAMKRLDLSFSTMVCSPLRRSHQSAALVAEAVRYPYTDIVESAAVYPEATAAEGLVLLRSLPEPDAVLIAGHLPALERLSSALLIGSDRLRLRFPNGGLTLLELETAEPGEAELVWQLSPPQLRLLAGH